MNLAYVAASLEQDDHEVRIVDLACVNPPMTEDEVLQMIRQFDPHWIGLTLNVIFIQPAYEFIKKLRPLNIPLVAGGPHPSLLAEECLDQGFDIVVRGEGEETVRELTRSLVNNSELDEVKGISYRSKEGEYYHNPSRPLIRDLDALPLPAKHLFSKEWYIKDSPFYEIYGPIFSGRGCPANCQYCYKGVFGHGCRLRSAESVFQEMLHLHKTFGVNAFEFMDDAFSADLERISNLCDMILKEPDFQPVWQCTTRLDLTTPALLKKMYSAGCFRIFYGVESGDTDTLDRVNKHLDLPRAIQVLKWTREAKIKSITGFMWGFPWDSPSSLRSSLDFLRQMAPYTNEFNPLGILIPVPGTGIYNRYKDRYHLDNWWLQNRFGRLYRTNAYFPYYMRRFYNDFALIDDGFFPFPPEVKKMIRQGTRFIGRHNLYSNTAKPIAYLVHVAVITSRILFSIHPLLEQSVFGVLGEIKARIKKFR